MNKTSLSQLPRKEFTGTSEGHEHDFNVLLESIAELKKQLEHSIGNTSNHSDTQNTYLDSDEADLGGEYHLNPQKYIAYIKRVIKSRQDRNRFFKAELFADPAWDILLDLYLAKLENRPVSVSSACIASCVPTTTALRWLTMLEKHQLIERKRDKNDLRRVFVELTKPAKIGMDSYFTCINS